MNLIGMMVVRNEAWCLQASLRAALQWCDSLVVLDHASVDKTPDIIEDVSNAFPNRIHWLEEHAPAWREAEIRQRMFDKAREKGATHFAVVDADEFLTSNGVGAIRHTVGLLKRGVLLRIPWYQCWRSLDHCRCDLNSGFGAMARVPFVFSNTPNLFYKADADGYQLHKRVPVGLCEMTTWETDAGYGVLHCQHAVWDRVVAKQKLYAMQEMKQFGTVRANYAAATDEVGLETRIIPLGWWPIDTGLLDLAAVPWQVGEVERLSK